MADTSDEEVDLAAFDEHEFEIPLVTCEWLDCGQQFWELEPMIDHIHDAHMNTNKTKYCCEWTGCPRRGKVQTSRFALLSHIRSHTGEKPFMCPRPECDKAFTRTDALQKHARIQHSNEGRKPPPPNTMAAAMLNLSAADSASSKKRKLEDGTSLDVKDGGSTPKHGGIDDEDLEDEDTPARNTQQIQNFQNGSTALDSTAPIQDYDEETLEFFKQHPDQSPDYLGYVAILNKHDLLMSEHETLLHELELLRGVEQKLVQAKDSALQQVLVKRFGNDANVLFNPISHDSFAENQSQSTAQEQPPNRLQQEHQHPNI